MENPIKSVLGLTTKEFEDIAHGKLGILQDKKTSNLFHLHDVVTGKKLKSVQVGTHAVSEERDRSVDEYEKDD